MGPAEGRGFGVAGEQDSGVAVCGPCQRLGGRSGDTAAAVEEDLRRGLSRGPASSPASHLLDRVEKLEEDLRSAATIVQALSRKLEKLGIRFRLTRKALKEPIAETAVLVQKNSEATQALAAQEDVLEKELGEIQKVLLSMQEQQQKQLELILAIGKAGKLWDSKRVKGQEQRAPDTPKPAAKPSNLEINQIEMMAWQKDGNNDRP